MGNFGISSQNQKALGGQDTTQLLQRIFFGRVVGSPPFPYGGMTGVVQSSTDSTVTVTLDDFDVTGQTTFTCTYEPRSAGNPPQDTPCFVVWPANGDHTPWVTSFGGWPS